MSHFVCSWKCISHLNALYLPRQYKLLSCWLALEQREHRALSSCLQAWNSDQASKARVEAMFPILLHMVQTFTCSGLTSN